MDDLRIDAYRVIDEANSAIGPAGHLLENDEQRDHGERRDHQQLVIVDVALIVSAGNATTNLLAIRRTNAPEQMTPPGRQRVVLTWNATYCITFC
jgi:cob(I)alamin adenosyltransferase